MSDQGLMLAMALTALGAAALGLAGVVPAAFVLTAFGASFSAAAIVGRAMRR